MPDASARTAKRTERKGPRTGASQARAARKRTEQSKTRFLEVYSELGNVSYAAKEAGVGRRTVYDWIGDDEDFAVAFNDAHNVATELLELEARRRAVEGVERPVFQGGQEVGRVCEYSDRLLEVLLKANRPEKYRERVSTEISGPAGGPVEFTQDVTTMTDAELDSELVELLTGDPRLHDALRERGLKLVPIEKGTHDG